MAVLVRLTSRGIPSRAAPACFPIASTPIRATGGLAHRVEASFGTVPTATPGPSNLMPIPPGPTAGHTAATGGFMYPAWSIIRRALPRLLPTAGAVRHGVPNESYTLAIPQPAQDLTVKPAIKIRTGAARGRVTTNPNPTFNWVRQGG